MGNPIEHIGFPQGRIQNKGGTKQAIRNGLPRHKTSESGKGISFEIATEEVPGSDVSTLRPGGWGNQREEVEILRKRRMD